MSLKNVASALRVAIVADDKTSKGIKSAKKNINALESSVKNLGKSFGIAFGVSAVSAFGKATVKAFEADQKSAALLANTMKNLGLQFANPAVEDFINSLSQAAGVADDQLRPSMQKLLQVTGSVVKSQELLKNAIDISRGSGVDLETVVQDISSAFVGNNKGLKKYAIGLTQAELKTASFDTVMQQFNKNFSGANAAYLNTYAGQMQKLNVAAGEAKETIGKGLIDAFKILAGDTSIGTLSDKMATLATHIADFFRGLAQGFKDLSNMPIIHQLIQLAGLMLKIAGKVAGAVIDPFVKAGAQSRSSALAPASSNAFLSEHMATSNAAKAAKAEKDAKARAAAILKSQQANTKALKEQALLKKQSALFDMQQIELVAALKGKLSDEDRKRAELQLALLQGDEDTAKRLTAQIADAIDKTGNLKTYLNSITATNDPFKNWMDSLEKIAAKAATIGMSGTDSASMAGTVATNTGTTNTGSTYGAAYAPLLDYAKGVSVTINNAGSVISEKELLAQIINGTQLASMSASPTTLSRIAGMFGN